MTKLRKNTISALEREKEEEAPPALEQTLSRMEEEKLREELEKVKEDAGRLMQERDKLIEVSNKLRASMNQMMSTSVDGQPHLGHGVELSYY